MLVFDVSEFTQNATKVFNSALTDEVIINNVEFSDGIRDNRF